MLVGATTLMLAALVAGEPEFAVRFHAPPDPHPVRTPDPGPVRSPAPAELPIPYNDGVPTSHADELAQRPQDRKLGTRTTVFVNFDGVEIGYCEPSNSHANCGTIEDGNRFDPFSGNLAQRVAILDAMRSLVAEFGIRVTGQRPPDDEPYVMVVYGGDSIGEDALGRAPAGDCWDDLPNQVAHVYLDGERSGWVNGGAATALHEAGHTWGLDHIGLEGSIMAPAGDNTKSHYFDGCAQIVEDTELAPGGANCPEINLDQCGLSQFQHDVQILRMLFGAPYVDDQAPTLELVSPFDGVYFQGPASFHVELAVVDDLHPQTYELALSIPGLLDDPSFSPVLDPSFDVEALPIGEWTFELRIRDAAGNEGSLAFEVLVGDQAPELDDGCACRSREPGPARAPLTGLMFALALGFGLRPRGREPS